MPANVEFDVALIVKESGCGTLSHKTNTDDFSSSIVAVVIIVAEAHTSGAILGHVELQFVGAVPNFRFGVFVSIQALDGKAWKVGKNSITIDIERINRRKNPHQIVASVDVRRKCGCDGFVFRTV